MSPAAPSVPHARPSTRPAAPAYVVEAVRAPAPERAEGERTLADNACSTSEQSKYSIYQEFGGQHQFMASYGLKPDPDGYEEARQIAEAMIESDKQSKE